MTKTKITKGTKLSTARGVISVSDVFTRDGETWLKLQAAGPAWENKLVNIEDAVREGTITVLEPEQAQ